MRDNAGMNESNDPSDDEVQPSQQAPATVDPRRRLRELLSIPEGQRTDPQWDEIIELEVQLAPGNRIGGDLPRTGNRPHGQPNPQQGPKPGGNNFKRHGPNRKFSKPKKPA